MFHSRRNDKALRTGENPSLVQDTHSDVFLVLPQSANIMETPPATPQVASQPPPKEEDLISSTDFTLFAAASAQAVADTVTEDRKNQRDYYILTTRFESELHMAQVDSDRRQHGLQQVSAT